MTKQTVDIVIVGAGPVGLLCAYLSHLCSLKTIVIDKSTGPLEVGRADALNARTLQLLEVIDLFDDLYPIGKKCNTSSVWSKGGFISRQSSWWDELEGCLHKHFLMIGQSYVEKLLDQKLRAVDEQVKRSTTVVDIEVNEGGCRTTLSTGESIQSQYVIGADGSRSFVRTHFQVPFQIERPQLIWAVLDGVVETDFPKVPEIINFQGETSDVAWIPREGNIDRFYVRMDSKDFTLADAIEKIGRVLQPHTLRFSEITWFSQFSVKESVAEKFFIEDRIFLAGDACHIHSVNGGQGLNTGLADAFNLIWKIHMVKNFGASPALLQSYEDERKPIAQSVLETSGELVRSTKYSETGTHALDYVKIVQRRAGNVTGMGIRYGDKGLEGQRVFDFEVSHGSKDGRLYSLLDYRHYTLLVFGEVDIEWTLPPYVKILQIHPKATDGLWSERSPYKNQVILVRPDSYIAAAFEIHEGGLHELIQRSLTHVG
jgi:2-polyprenyl-6-methoxyphenol hydroxylase-like FAD-dependent oxidoreductase